MRSHNTLNNEPTNSKFDKISLVLNKFLEISFVNFFLNWSKKSCEFLQISPSTRSIISSPPQKKKNLSLQGLKIIRDTPETRISSRNNLV